MRLVQLLEPAAFTPTPRPFPTGFPLFQVLLQLLPPALYNFFENVTHFSGTEVNQPLEQDLFLPMIYKAGLPRVHREESSTVIGNAYAHTRVRRSHASLRGSKKMPEDTPGLEPVACP